MIPDVSHGLKTTGNLEAGAGAMTIDADNMTHIMSILIDLYEDPELAVIREYATNAYDAHIDAGITQPIEITTPTLMDPYYVIQDYGIGMSVDDIKNIYTSYGSSTKRGSNEAVGMLGLGSKSGLTYAKQFTVVAVKNGVKASVLIMRKDTGEGVYNVVDTAATDEPNGVRIQIPVKQRNTFAEKANHFFSFWEPGTVLVNGEEPRRFLEKVQADEIEPGVFVYEQRNAYLNAESYIVMGNVPYKVSNFHQYLDPKMQRFFAQQGFVAIVPIGAVNFTPNREGLHYTPKTEAEVKRIGKIVTDGFLQMVKDSINTAPSYAEAFVARRKWFNRLPGEYLSALTYNGEKFPDDEKLKFTGVQWDTQAARYTTNNLHYPEPVERFLSATFVTDKPDAENLSAHRKRQIKKYYEEAGIPLPRLIYFGPKVSHKWTTDQKELSWDDIKAVELPKPVRNGSTRPKGSWDFYSVVDAKDRTGNKIRRGERHEAQPLPSGTTLLWVPAAKFRGHSAIKPEHALTFVQENVTLVVVPANRVAKFLRDNPKAGRWSDWAEKKAEAIAKNVDKEYLRYESIDYYYRNHLSRLGGVNMHIEDPDLRDQVSLVRKYQNASGYSDFDKAVEFARYANVKSPERQAHDPMVNLLNERYPLYNSSHTRHSIEYINLVYKERNK